MKNIICGKKKPQPSPGPLPHFNISFYYSVFSPQILKAISFSSKEMVCRFRRIPWPPKLLYAVCAAGIGPSIASCGAGI